VEGDHARLGHGRQLDLAEGEVSQGHLEGELRQGTGLSFPHAKVLATDAQAFEDVRIVHDDDQVERELRIGVGRGARHQEERGLLLRGADLQRQLVRPQLDIDAG
jgi:hypothetical protein